ncbi:hypothetical protein JCM10212_001555 [Sporobolomyces blumeae]
MATHGAPDIDVFPRHLQQQQHHAPAATSGPTSTSTSSSAQASPIPTPSQPRSPLLVGSQALSSSPSAAGFAHSVSNPSSSAGAPSSPSLGSSNRFGLSLGNLVRRPRGWTTSSAQRSPGAISPSGNDQPPSPSGAGGAGNGERSGYGFPALRRSLSKRTASNGAGANGTSAGEGSSSSSRARPRRSSSQPPNSTFRSDAGDNVNAGRTPTSSGEMPARPAAPARGTSSTTSSGGDASEPQKLRLVPHLESSRSLHFEPIERDLAPFAIVKVGRFTDRSNHHYAQSGSTPTDPARVAFKSKVVSRGHAEVWADGTGKFFIKDTKSSSGTFLNHIRLSSPNTESRPFPLKDGDVLQLGVDYQGGTEEIYRCVKMRVELNRAWQRGANSFNTAALAQLRALGGGSSMEPTPTSGTAMTAAASSSSTKPNPTPTPLTAAQQAQQAAAAAASITDCCICLYPVTVCQALFIAPCSHVTHFKCIRPLVEQNYPGFCCPLCRTYADLEADVEIDPPELPVASEPTSSEIEVAERPSDSPAPGSMAPVEEADEPASRSGSRANSIRSGRPGNSRRSSAIAIAGPDGLPPGITVTPHRGRSRPSSRAPSIIEARAPATEEEEQDGDEGDGQAESSSVGSERGVDDVTESARRAIGSSPLAMPVSNSHLAATTQAELYASLANAATPPNNTFLSTLADSSALHLAGVPTGFRVPTPGGSANDTPLSLDAAMEQVERPNPTTAPVAAGSAETGPERTSAEASRSGSGSGGEETERDGEGSVGDEVDREERHVAGSSGLAEPLSVVAGAGKGKGKGKGKEGDDVPADAIDHAATGIKQLSVDDSSTADETRLSV